MKRILILVILVITFTIDTIGQNLVFIKEKSFPSTEAFILASNSDKHRITDLKLVFAKEGERGLLVVSSKLPAIVKITGKLIIYLNDGTVITFLDKGINDNVDDVATTAYYLTNEEIAKLKKSNINTVRYEIKCTECLSHPLYEGNFSASNKAKTDFTKVISDFFKE